VTRRKLLDAQHATTRTRSRAPRRHGFQITDNRLFSASLDEFRSGDHERREAALKVTDMAAAQHDCALGDQDTCGHPDHERDADLARMALDAFGLADLADDEDFALEPEPAAERGKYDARLSRSTFTRPDWRWQDSAVCRGEDLAVFFGREGESRAERDIREAYAKDLCDMCPVRATCLEYAFSKPEKYGVYGGLTEDERKEQRRNWQRRKRAAA
jgi:WhiB family redox-sensing transcriptional regulator